MPCSSSLAWGMVSTLMVSRVSCSRFGSGQAARATVMETGVPGLPRRRSTASCRSMLTVDCSPMRVMKSLDRTPARWAGVFLSTRTTVRLPSRMAMTKPSPPNSPRVCSFISLKYFGSSTTECGSSVERTPEAAAYSISRRSSWAIRFSCTNPITSPSSNRAFQMVSTSLIWKSRVALPTVTVSWSLLASPLTITSATVRSTDSSAATTMALGSIRDGST